MKHPPAAAVILVATILAGGTGPRQVQLALKITF